MIKFEEIPNELEKNGKLLAQYTAEYEFMDDMTKTILASEAPEEGTEAYKEREARKSPAYKTHIEGKMEARQRMLEAKTTQDALQARFEWYRTQSANRRTEMKLL